MLTARGEAAAQRRGITMDAIEVLLRFGASTTRRGREVVYMTRAGRDRARAALGRETYAKLERRIDCGIVLDCDGNIRNCFHRRARIYV